MQLRRNNSQIQLEVKLIAIYSSKNIVFQRITKKKITLIFFFQNIRSNTFIW